jgi:hypothetical protein
MSTTVATRQVHCGSVTERCESLVIKPDVRDRGAAENLPEPRPLAPGVADDSARDTERRPCRTRHCRRAAQRESHCASHVARLLGL